MHSQCVRMKNAQYLPAHDLGHNNSINYTNSIVFPSALCSLIRALIHTLHSIHVYLCFQIGICGKSGSGKSSLANSLFGVIEIACGQIVIDSIDISRVRLNELRSRLSIIPQDDGILFCSTVRENLDPLGCFSDVQLWQCLETVHLKALIAALPEKLGKVGTSELFRVLLRYFI